jgi:DNA-binding XRE family transcriptional regulator
MNIPNSISTEEKQELCRIMASNLSTLREKAKLKQDELADKLGLSRQTISAIENEKREMQWSTFSVLIMFFANDYEIRQIMSVMGIMTEKVAKIFNIGS